MNDASIRFIAVGHAGAQILNGLRTRSRSPLECAHADTSPESLRISPIDRRITLGLSVSHGLGAGGDPDIGRLSAEADQSSIREFTRGARLVFVVAGLGGGTGSGAAPVIARAARESGALVLVIATTPFDFERRRLAYARESLDRLRVAADAVLAISNQRVRRMHDDRTHPHELYQFANELLAQTLQGLWRLLDSPGLIPLEFAHIERLLRGRHSESAFAAVQATGENRAHAAAEQLLTHPFLDTGAALAAAREVLVSVAGGDDLQIGEVERLVEALQARCPTAEFIVGASIDPALTGDLHVTAIATRPSASAASDLVGSGFARNDPEPPASKTGPEVPAPATDGFNGEDFSPESEGRTLADPRLIPPPPELNIEQRQRILSRQRIKPSRRRPDSQMLMNFDIAQRGRFDNTERNRHKGVDLDVPTYLRLGIILN
ncbi:MAG: Cell division protein FtsZ [Verrucomicrobiota bacterium]|jgi:cell division protein FtsZ